MIKQVPSNILLMGSPPPNETVSLTPLGEACSKMDLTAIHELLERLGYKDDEGIANEVSNFYLCLLQSCPSSNLHRNGENKKRKDKVRGRFGERKAFSLLLQTNISAFL